MTDRRDRRRSLAFHRGKKEISFSGGDALKRNFYFVVAVDTNTRTVHGKQVSVTGVVTAKHMMMPGPNGLVDHWKFDVPFYIEFAGVKTKPEKSWVGGNPRAVAFQTTHCDSNEDRHDCRFRSRQYSHV